MSSALQFATRKRKGKKKKRTCSKGYDCGNSCINTNFNCKKKLPGQASNYAGWLKIQAEKTLTKSKQTRQQLNQLARSPSTSNNPKRIREISKRLNNKRRSQLNRVPDKILPRLDLMGAAQLALGDRFVLNAELAREGAKIIAKTHNLPEDYYAVVRTSLTNALPAIIVNPDYISPQTERLQDQLKDTGLTTRVRTGLENNLARSQQNDIDAARKGNKLGILSQEQLRRQVEAENKALGRKKPKTSILRNQNRRKR